MPLSKKIRSKVLRGLSVFVVERAESLNRTKAPWVSRRECSKLGDEGYACGAKTADEPLGRNGTMRRRGVE